MKSDPMDYGLIAYFLWIFFTLETWLSTQFSGHIGSKIEVDGLLQKHATMKDLCLVHKLFEGFSTNRFLSVKFFHRYLDTRMEALFRNMRSI